MSINMQSTIECRAGLHTLTVSLNKKITTLEISNPLTVSNGVKQIPVARIGLNADGILLLLNKLLSIIPYQIETTAQALSAVTVGIPVTNHELQSWVNGSVERSDNLSRRGWLALYLQSLLEISDDKAIDSLISHLKRTFPEELKDSRILRQQLKMAENQHLKALREKKTYEKTNHFGTTAEFSVVDINEFIRKEDASTE